MSERKAIFVTGGGSGIGRAIARYFGDKGWFVGLGDVDAQGMEDTLALIPGGFKYAHKFDVRDRDAWDVALQAFETAAGGRIDVAANNAGIPLAGMLQDNTKDEIDRCLDINLRGMLYGAQASFPLLLKTAPGSCLLNTASAAGLVGDAAAPVYSATKFGVYGMTESLDAGWSAMGVNVRSLCPAFIETPLLEQSPNQGTNFSIRSQVVNAGLEITPVEEVAKAAWDAVHGDRLHTLVGKTAHKIAFAKRWMPGRLRKQTRRGKPLGQ